MKISLTFKKPWNVREPGSNKSMIQIMETMYLQYIEV